MIKPHLIIIIISFLLFFPQFKIEPKNSPQSIWSTPQRIPGYSIDTSSPFLVADSNETVHAFASQWIGYENPQLAIMYSQWTLDGGWTLPVDIVLSPVKEARIMGVLLDETGLFHIIFFGGEEPSGDLYYTQAPAIHAGITAAWSSPKLIGRNAIIPDSAAITGNNDGDLYVIYGGNLNNRKGQYYITSPDRGISWTDPNIIFPTGNPELIPYGIRLFAGQSGYIHAVWYVVDDLGHNVSAHYNNFNSIDGQWGKTIELAKGYGIDEGMGISNIELIEYKSMLYVIYNNGIPPEGVPPAQWVLVSNDQGKTWGKPYRPFPQHVGRSGVISLVVDSSEKLHFLFADRIPIFKNGTYSAIGGLFHSVWLSSNQWTDPEAVFDTSQGLDISNGIIGPYGIQAVISQGNIILCTWRSDPGGDDLGVWFSYILLDSPALPLKPLPTFPFQNLNPLNPPNFNNQTPNASHTRIPVTDLTPISKTNDSQTENFSSGIILGIVSACILIFSFFILRIRAISSRR